jgi:hypothetical protein
VLVQMGVSCACTYVKVGVQCTCFVQVLLGVPCANSGASIYAGIDESNLF